MDGKHKSEKTLEDWWINVGMTFGGRLVATGTSGKLQNIPTEFKL